MSHDPSSSAPRGHAGGNKAPGRRHFLDYSVRGPAPDDGEEEERAHRGGGGTVAAEQSAAEHEGNDKGSGHVRGDGAHHCEGELWLQVVHQAKETPHQPWCKKQVPGEGQQAQARQGQTQHPVL